MIQVNELRIGNYVYYADNKTVLKVDGGHICYPSKMHPIPLTEEILLKCGFEQTSIISIFEKDEFTLENWDDNEFIFRWNDFTISVGLKHLHKLQNIYFALKNEELEINL